MEKTVFLFSFPNDSIVRVICIRYVANGLVIKSGKTRDAMCPNIKWCQIETLHVRFDHLCTLDIQHCTAACNKGTRRRSDSKNYVHKWIRKLRVVTCIDKVLKFNAFQSQDSDEIHQLQNCCAVVDNLLLCCLFVFVSEVFSFWLLHFAINLTCSTIFKHFAINWNAQTPYIEIVV